MYVCKVKLMKNSGLGKVALAVLTLCCAAAVVAVLIRTAAPVTSSYGPAREQDNRLGSATLVPSASTQQRQEPTGRLSRMMTELPRLLPQAGEVLGAGLVWRGFDIRLEHYDGNGSLPTFDEVRVVGHSSRKGALTVYRLFLRKSPSVAENPSIAEKCALWMTFTQRVLPPEPGIPEGTFTGLPIGEWSRYSAPDPRPGTPPVREMGCALTVYDSTIALYSSINYEIKVSGGRPGSDRITDEDLLMAEYQARLILSAALLVENDFESMRRGEMAVGALRVPTRRTGDGVTLVPLARWAEAVGATVVSGVPGRGMFSGGFVPVLPDSGVWTISRGGRTVVVPLAARALIVGSERVNLPFPVVRSGGDVWIAVEGLRRALSG